MTIRIADKNDFETVKEITHKTIGEVYLLITDEGDAAGTVTISDNEIDRLFVLPSYQHKGYGDYLCFDNMEKTV